jgi:hypothetical protein
MSDTRGPGSLPQKETKLITPEMEDTAVRHVTSTLRNTEARKDLREALRQDDDALEALLASAAVQRRFWEAVRAYFVEHIPTVLEKMRTSIDGPKGDAQARLFLDLGGVGEKLSGLAPAPEDSADDTMNELEREMVRNVREILADAQARGQE